MRKCKMTVTGKHIWNGEFEVSKFENIAGHRVLKNMSFYKQCVCCRMVDDRTKIKK